MKKENVYIFEVYYSHAPRNRPQISDYAYITITATTEKQATREVKKAIRERHKYATQPHVFGHIRARLKKVEQINQ